MKNVDFESIKPKLITEINTQIGYLQVLEYTLQDCSYLHVVQYHFNSDVEAENYFLPKIHCKTYYKKKDKALKLAHEVGNQLLVQYDIP